MAKQTQNYTDEQLKEMVAEYTAVPTDETHEEQRAAVVKMLADKFGKGEQSIRQKLVQADVYIAKVPKNKAGKKAETKQAVATEIGNIVGMPESYAESLTLAGKPALQMVRNVLLEMQEELAAYENAKQPEETIDSKGETE